jgi:hypothetical protein
MYLIKTFYTVPTIPSLVIEKNCKLKLLNIMCEYSKNYCRKNGKLSVIQWKRKKEYPEKCFLRLVVLPKVLRGWETSKTVLMLLEMHWRQMRNFRPVYVGSIISSYSFLRRVLVSGGRGGGLFSKP